MHELMSSSSKRFVGVKFKWLILLLCFLFLKLPLAISQKASSQPHLPIQLKKTLPRPVLPTLRITLLSPAIPIGYKQLAVNFNFSNYDQANKFRIGSIHGQIISTKTNATIESSNQVFTINKIAPGNTISGTILFPSLKLGPNEKVELQYYDVYDSSVNNSINNHPIHERYSSKILVTTFQELPFTDNDQDGIDDNTEHALLNRFRPYYMFSKHGGDENFAPTDALWYISRAVLLNHDNNDPYTPNRILSANQGAILYPPHFIKNVYINNDPDTENILTTHSTTKNDMHLSILGHYSHAKSALIVSSEDNPNIHGMPWQNVRGDKNIVLNGFYGHVVPIRLQNPGNYSFFDSANNYNGNIYYKIEYWQFFAFNSDGMPGNIGDHEADWCSVQILFDPLNDKIISVFDFAHGFCFAYHMSQTTTTVDRTNADGNLREYQGINYTTKIDLKEHNILDFNTHKGDSLKAQNNVVRMFQDPDTKEFVHPIVYIEHGSHEFFPSEYWNFYGAPNHKGDDADHTFLTPTPPNLGEVEHPLNETSGATIILQYDGFWGAYNHDNTPPMGPALHQEFQWPGTSSIRWLLPSYLGF